MKLTYQSAMQMLDEWAIFQEDGILAADSLLRKCARDYLSERNLGKHQVMWAAQLIISDVGLSIANLIKKKLAPHRGTPAVIMINTNEIEQALFSTDAQKV